jgi:hypothetical protein
MRAKQKIPVEFCRLKAQTSMKIAPFALVAKARSAPLALAECRNDCFGQGGRFPDQAGRR